MNELITALQICLKFAPVEDKPGLNGVFFDFSVEDTILLYATDGHCLARFKITGIPIQVTDEPYFITDEMVKEVIDKLQTEQEITVTTWGNDIMFIAGTEIVTVSRREDGLDGKYKTFFNDPMYASAVAIDYDRLHNGIAICSPVLAVYKNSGPVFEVTTQTSPLENGKMVVVSPRLSQDLGYIEEIKIAIMYMDV